MKLFQSCIEFLKIEKKKQSASVTRKILLNV